LPDRHGHAETRCRLSPLSRQVVPPFSPMFAPSALFTLCEQPLGPPPAQSRSKTRASGALVRSPTDESSEPPMYISYSKTVEFCTQAQEVRSYEKRIMTFHMHILGRWWQGALGAGLRGDRPRFPEVVRGYRGHGDRCLQSLLDVEERSRAHLPPTYTCEGILRPPPPSWSGVTA
jgi:hypothetical protein